MQYNPYNNYNGYDMLEQEYVRRLQEKTAEKRQIKKLATYAGLAVLLYSLIQYVLSFALLFSGFAQYYYESPFFRCGFEILVVIVSILPVFLFFNGKMKRVSGEREPLMLGAPSGGVSCLLAVIAGTGLCMAANYVSAVVTVFAAAFGFELSSPELAMPEGVFGILLSTVQISLTAALVEELSLRGVTMGNLRKYGDGFAIAVSAVVFALIHGNLIQSPFALIAGAGMGYFCVRTGSLWTGILIHGLNNLISVLMTYAAEAAGDEVGNTLFFAVTGFFIFTGIICFALFISRKDVLPLKKGSDTLTVSERVAAYFTSIPMLIVVVLMLLTTLLYISPLE